jgi:hypothetical protein
MKFKKFQILNTKEGHLHEEEEQTMLINLDHIISIKPIRINRPNMLIDGYWIRTSNGKKYRATVIPPELDMVLEEPFQSSAKAVNFDENSLQ